VQTQILLSADRTALDIRFAQEDGGDSRLRVTTPDGSTHEITLPSWFRVGLASRGRDAAVFGGSRLHLFPGAADPLILELNDEIHRAYFTDDLLLILGETSVIVIEARSGDVRARYDHPEVLGQPSWDGDDIIFQDWNGRRVRVRLLQPSGALTAETT